MKNLIIPNPTNYEITYLDRKGQRTSRRIVVISQDSKNLKAWCYKRRGLRVFSKEKIESITSVS